MNADDILRALIAERDRINGVIAALGGSAGSGKVRKVRGPMSEETKQKMRDAWAKRRRASKRAAKA